MANQTVIKVELQGLQDLSQALDSEAIKEKVAKNIRIFVSQYLRIHFDNSSLGKGSWKPLSAKTERSRRPAAPIDKKNAEQTSLKQHFASRADILRDTGQLFAGLYSQDAPGHKESLTIENGKVTFEFGYGGNDQWIPPKKKDEEPQETKKERKPITISALACIHHYGVPGKIPARPIVVPLDEATIKKIETKIEEIILREAK